MNPGYGILIGLVFGVAVTLLASTIPRSRRNARRDAARRQATELLDHLERAVYTEVRHTFATPDPNDREAIRLAADVRAARYMLLNAII